MRCPGDLERVQIAPLEEAAFVIHITGQPAIDGRTRPRNRRPFPWVQLMGPPQMKGLTFRTTPLPFEAWYKVV